MRSRAWSTIIGNDLQLTEELFNILRARARDLRAEQKDAPSASQPDNDEKEPVPRSKEHTLRLIELDVPRTFPSLQIFQPNGPLFEPLLSVLQAYVCYRPDVGYVQGMSYLASMLILNMEPFDAFVGFANILHQPVYFRFFCMDETHLRNLLKVFDSFFAIKLKDLHSHFSDIGVTSDMFLYEWLLTIYGRCLPLDITHRVWDNFLFYGPVFLFRVALGILRMYSDKLHAMTFEATLSFLNHLPDDMQGRELFESTQQIEITATRFEQMLVQVFNNTQQ